MSSGQLSQKIPCQFAKLPYLVLCAYRGTDDELVDVIELIPVLIARVHVSKEGLKLGPAGNAHVERLGRDEGVGVKEVEVVQIRQVTQKLACIHAIDFVELI